MRRLRSWTHGKALWALSAVVAAETLVLLIMSFPKAMLLTLHLLHSVIEPLFTFISGKVSWLYVMVGPMLFPLLMLNLLELWIIFDMVRAGADAREKRSKNLKLLEGIEYVSPGFGFLGTIISLMKTMWSMDPNLSQKAMLKVLLNNCSSAFGSTAYGIMLQISTYILRRYFETKGR